jgi:chitin synthase
MSSFPYPNPNSPPNQLPLPYSSPPPNQPNLQQQPPPFSYPNPNVYPPSPYQSAPPPFPQSPSSPIYPPQDPRFQAQHDQFISSDQHDQPSTFYGGGGHHDAYGNHDTYEKGPLEEYNVGFDNIGGPDPLGHDPNYGRDGTILDRPSAETLMNPFENDDHHSNFPNPHDNVPLLPSSNNVRIPGGYEDNHRRNDYDDDGRVHYGSIPARQPRRYKTVKRVELYQGNFVLDCKVPQKVLEIGKYKEGREFTHMR